MIDYSLLVMKVNWKQYGKDKNISKDEYEKEMKHLENELMIQESILEEGIYYHIGLIDYF